MNRVFKFRVWDIQDECFLQSYANNGESFIYNTYVTGIDWFIQCARLENPKRFIIQQFTGHKDKNGTDIFEGDLISPNESNYTHKILWDEKDSRFCMDLGTSIGLCKIRVDGLSLTVVGNILENPEFLL